MKPVEKMKVLTSSSVGVLNSLLSEHLSTGWQPTSEVHKAMNSQQWFVTIVKYSHTKEDISSDRSVD